ncbi:hypothetical protein PAPYR_5478 [Paratrimastix pyriformis]|uniref:Uncharacterized protein n=1 Tax=Paratrimastix pyriformis TaxID=342808 RepID=A0ABQ8UHK7_9EUKA|nr:hypothetical protein PAPYR_5478 [Paratrimastix pyriformis]
MEICSENDDLDGDVSNFVMTHAEIKRNDDPFMRFLNRDISEKHLRYTDLDSDFKVLTQKMLPELAKLFGYITVHKQQVVSRELLKTIVEMLGSLEREMLVSSMTDFFYQVLGSVTWHAGQSDLESISSESSEELPMMRLPIPFSAAAPSLREYRQEWGLELNCVDDAWDADLVPKSVPKKAFFRMQHRRFVGSLSSGMDFSTPDKHHDTGSGDVKRRVSPKKHFGSFQNTDSISIENPYQWSTPDKHHDTADQHIQIACSFFPRACILPRRIILVTFRLIFEKSTHNVASAKCFLKEHAQCGKREVFLEFFNRAEEDDRVFHDLDHISTFKNSMLDEFCKLFGHLGFSSGALPSSTLLKGIIESLQKGCSPAVSRDRSATTLHHLILATLRHPQLTTLLTLQLRQKVFLRVPISVVGDRDVSIPAHSNCVLALPSCMHIAEENHLSDFQAHFLKEHAQCGKREVFLEFFNRAEEDDLVFHDLDHISTFKNSMLDEFCKLFGHLGFSSGALPSSTLLKGIIESLQKGCSPAVSRDRIATTLHHLILATLRHPQLTTLLTLQLRQEVFLRVPISVVGTGTCPFPTPRSRVRSRSPKHADAKGGSPRPSAKKAARTEATSTRKLPASPPAREVSPPRLRPPAATVSAPGPVPTEQGKPLLQSALGLAQAGWKAIKGPFARAAAPTKPAAAKSSVLAPLHHLPTSCPSDPPSRPSAPLPSASPISCADLGVRVVRAGRSPVPTPDGPAVRDFSWLRASTVYVCYTHARWYMSFRSFVSWMREVLRVVSLLLLVVAREHCLCVLTAALISHAAISGASAHPRMRTSGYLSCLAEPEILHGIRTSQTTYDRRPPPPPQSDIILSMVLETLSPRIFALLVSATHSLSFVCFDVCTHCYCYCYRYDCVALCCSCNSAAACGDPFGACSCAGSADAWQRPGLAQGGPVFARFGGPAAPAGPAQERLAQGAPAQTRLRGAPAQTRLKAMACEITAVNDDLDDETSAFIEKHASILDEDDPLLCFIDVLDDHRAIFRSMDQLSRLSFTSTMIPEFGKLFGYLVASEKRIPSTKLLQRISLSILRSAGGDQSLCCQKLAQLIQFICAATIFNLESSTKAVTVSRVSMATPVPARPVASVNPSTASPQSGLCPKSPSTVKQPPGKVTAHCIAPPLHRFSWEVVRLGHGASLCPKDLGLKGSGAARVPLGLTRRVCSGRVCVIWLSVCADSNQAGTLGGALAIAGEGTAQSQPAATGENPLLIEACLFLENQAQMGGALSLREYSNPAGPDGPRKRDFGWWIREQHAPMFVFRTATRWYMGTRLPNAQEVPM